MAKKTVAIIGAGLAGLNCARLLKNSHSVTIFDSQQTVGGRVLSTQKQGMILDHGFQVFLSDYPEAKRAFDYSKLNLKPFAPGAKIKIQNKFYNFSDPARDPFKIFSTFFAPVGNFKDKLLILKLKQASKNPNESLKKIKTIDYLNDFGFSNEMISKFFKPFFSGVFLERELTTSAYFFSFIFSIFSNCNATVPEYGMMQLPLNLLDQLDNVSIKLNTKVNSFTENQVYINDEEIHFDFVICAYNNNNSPFNTVTTDYFETSSQVITENVLFLNGDQNGIINHIAPMSNVNKKYNINDKFLWSVNLLEPYHDSSVSDVEKELSKWFPGYSFNHVERFSIKKALPNTPLYGEGNIFKEGIYYCGDHMEDPSINGALKSGRLVAEKILKG